MDYITVTYTRGAHRPLPSGADVFRFPKLTRAERLWLIDTTTALADRLEGWRETYGDDVTGDTYAELAEGTVPGFVVRGGDTTSEDALALDEQIALSANPVEWWPEHERYGSEHTITRADGTTEHIELVIPRNDEQKRAAAKAPRPTRQRYATNAERQRAYRDRKRAERDAAKVADRLAGNDT